MNYLAAGRPGISPSHTAIADYFDSEVGLVVESHPEPWPWPQDSRLRWRSTLASAGVAVAGGPDSPQLPDGQARPRGL